MSCEPNLILDFSQYFSMIMADRETMEDDTSVLSWEMWRTSSSTYVSSAIFN